MSASVRWSPNSTLPDQRFLLADGNDGSLTIGNITGYDGKVLEYKLRQSYRKVPQFRAFDWASVDEDLVAVGQWSGEVTVARLDDKAAPVPFLAKHQRSCNSLSFNQKGLLATGLERVRNVEGLNVWDLNQRLPNTPSPGGRASKFAEPFRKLGSSEAISSVKFFQSQPDLILAGIKGTGVRLYDLRENTVSPSLQFPNARVQNIAIDPLDENFFACSGLTKDVVLQVWDCRSSTPYGSSAVDDHQNPVVEYSDAFEKTKNSPSPSISEVHYCKVKPGIIAALASSRELKVFETSATYLPRSNQNTLQDVTREQTPNASAERLYTKRVHNVGRSWHSQGEERSDNEDIVSFDFTNSAGSKGTPCMIVLRNNGDVAIQELSQPLVPFDISARNNLLIASPAPPFHPDNHSARKSDIMRNDGSSKLGSVVATDGHELKGQNNPPFTVTATSRIDKSTIDLVQNSAIKGGEAALDIGDALRLLELPRRRAKSGYNLDPKINLEMSEGDSKLQSLWSWIEAAQNNARDQKMVGHGLDLSYFGVESVWRSELNSDQWRRRSSDFEVAADVTDAVVALDSALQLPPVDFMNTEFPEHRRLCLFVCGFWTLPEEVEGRVQSLARANEVTKAAAFALIQNQPKLAFEVLKSGAQGALEKQLSLALAGYIKGATDAIWPEIIRDVAADLEDPYAHSIFTFCAHGDWHHVLKEARLPLADQIGIAMMYLNDKELTIHITKTLSQAVHEGNLEAIVLTGLTESAIPLFENYIRRTFDLQTTVLALAFASPRFFTDSRVDIWKETYRSYLDRWRFFIERTKFDILCVKLSNPQRHRSSVPLVPGQMFIRCAFCDQNLDRTGDQRLSGDGPHSSGTHLERVFGDARSGTSCPKCGRHLPRCVICMQWVGVPDPHTRGGVAQGMSKEEALERFTAVCRTCWHMSHASHSEQWFRRHNVCPVPGCDCRCTSLDVGIG